MPVPPHSEQHQHLAVFAVRPYLFCAPAHEIESITTVPHVTPLPKAPVALVGVVNHRGHVVQVISLRRKFALESGRPDLSGLLIVTELPTGLTAFMVDDVEEIIPADKITFQPLKAEGPIDAFDAFALQGERILFRTSFQRLYTARDIKGQRTSLARLAQDAARSRLALPAAAARPIETGPHAGPPEAITPPRRLPDHPSAQASTMAGARSDPRFPPAADPPPQADRIAARQSPPPVPTADRRSAAARHWRPPRGGRLASGAALLLLLLACLAAGPWLLRWGQHQKVLKAEATNAAPMVAGPAKVEQGTLPSPQSMGIKAQSSAPVEPAQGALTAAAIPDHSSAAAPQAGTTPSAKDAPAPPDPGLRTAAPDPKEVLRVETEAFTLTVERPSASEQSPPVNDAPAPHATPKEIRHVVVSGDTLWDIAAQYLGDPFQYPELARLSQIRDPDLIYPGDVIRIVPKAALPPHSETIPVQ